MKELDNPTPMWKTKEGHILINEMSPEHLQHALTHAEHRFIENHNMMMVLADKAEVFKIKMHQLRAEAERRGIQLKSLCDGKTSKKYSILRNEYKFAVKISEA